MYSSNLQSSQYLSLLCFTVADATAECQDKVANYGTGSLKTAPQANRPLQFCMIPAVQLKFNLKEVRESVKSGLTPACYTTGPTHSEGAG